MRTKTIKQLATENSTTVKDVKDKLIKAGVLQSDGKTLTNTAMDKGLARVERLPVNGRYFSSNVYDYDQLEYLLSQPITATEIKKRVEIEHDYF